MKPKKVFDDGVNIITIDHDRQRNTNYPFNIDILHHEAGVQLTLTMDSKELGKFIDGLANIKEKYSLVS